jgi:hypothetical protein
MAAVPQTVVPMKASEALVAGDIIIMTAGYAEDSNSATSGIFGVAMLPTSHVTAAATINDDQTPGPDTAGTWHTLNVALAWPNQKFAGNVIDAATADHTGVYADDNFKALEVAPSSDNFACVEDAVANPVVYGLGYVTPQWDIANSAWKYGRLAGVGITNPRIQFVFLATTTVFSV